MLFLCDKVQNQRPTQCRPLMVPRSPLGRVFQNALVGTCSVPLVKAFSQGVAKDGTSLRCNSWKRAPPMSNTKTPGNKAATAASKILQSTSTGNNSRTAAGSALSQTKAPRKQTSATAATAASQVLRDGRTSAASKSAAGSALAQAKGKGK